MVEVSLHPSVPGAVHLLRNTLRFYSRSQNVSDLHVLVILSGVPGVPFDSLKKNQKVSYSIYTKRQKENEDGFWISLQELLGRQMPNSDRMNPLL